MRMFSCARLIDELNRWHDGDAIDNMPQLDILLKACGRDTARVSRVIPGLATDHHRPHGALDGLAPAQYRANLQTKHLSLSQRC